jgi:hypothetical protein
MSNSDVQEDHAARPRAQWSRDSWGRVSSALLAIILAWWPVAATLHVAVVCRFEPAFVIAGGYVLYVGFGSWWLALLVAGSRRVAPNVLGWWMVFVTCLLPVPVIALRVPVFVAEFL